jgi:uncharacterized protein (DUF1499 family)
MMKLLLTLFFSSAAVIILSAFGLAFYSKSGQAPGLSNQKLTHCPGEPNCVCSENQHETKSYIEPLPLLADQQQAMAAIKTSIIALGGQIDSEQTHYIAGTFSSKLFGFVDDVEIRIDPELNQIHLRSASRIGYSDLGANRKRAMALKMTIQHHLDSMTGPQRDQ